MPIRELHQDVLWRDIYELHLSLNRSLRTLLHSLTNSRLRVLVLDRLIWECHFNGKSQFYKTILWHIVFRLEREVKLGVSREGHLSLIV